MNIVNSALENLAKIRETYILVIVHMTGITGYAIDALTILKICLNGH